MMTPDLAWRLQCNKQHRKIMAEFRTAEHDRAILAEALRFLVLKQQPATVQTYAPDLAKVLIEALVAMAMKGLAPVPPEREEGDNAAADQ